MAVDVLFGGAQFGHGATQRRDEHQRVIAEPALAARRRQDAAGPPTHRDQRLGIGRAAHGHQRADEPCGAVFAACQLAQQPFVVGGIGLLAAGVQRVAGGAHAGRPPERVHTEARVVGQCRQATGQRRMPRLGQRVLGKGVERLVGLRDAQAALGDQLDAQRREQALQLGKLLRVVGGEHEPHGLKPWSARTGRPAGPPATRGCPDRRGPAARSFRRG
mmetsp:Transcript_60047/g.142177  ORF Transcript_60047/g.142177 Transcript_60047/m.142177 type:complete len:218 (-) Transcript_60047:677-1330(-)